MSRVFQACGCRRFGTETDENSWIPGLRKDPAKPGRRPVLPNSQQPFQDQDAEATGAPDLPGRRLVSGPVLHSYREALSGSDQHPLSMPRC